MTGLAPWKQKSEYGSRLAQYCLSLTRERQWLKTLLLSAHRGPVTSSSRSRCLLKNWLVNTLLCSSRGVPYTVSYHGDVKSKSPLKTWNPLIVPDRVGFSSWQQRKWCVCKHQRQCSSTPMNKLSLCECDAQGNLLLMEPPLCLLTHTS